MRAPCRARPSRSRRSRRRRQVPLRWEAHRASRATTKRSTRSKMRDNNPATAAAFLPPRLIDPYEDSTPRASPPTWCIAEQERGAEALDLERALELAFGDRRDAPRRGCRERQDADKRDKAERREEPESVLPWPSRRHAHHPRSGTSTTGKNFAHGSDRECGSGRAMPARQGGGKCDHRERRGPEVVALGEHAAEQQRRHRHEDERSPRFAPGRHGRERGSRSWRRGSPPRTQSGAPRAPR